MAPGFGAIGELAIGQVKTGAASGAEFIGPDKYMRALSEPVRFLAGLTPSAQQFVAFHAQPVVSFSWFEVLAEPARAPPRSPAALYPNFFFHPAPSPFVPTGWFTALSEPVRFRSGLRAAAQPFFAIDTAVIPITKLMPWFAALAEPVRKRSGLDAARQQFLAAPSQLRPNPTISGVLSATETKDVFLAGAMSWNRITSGEMGIVVNRTPQAEIGIAPVQAILTAKMSISIL